MTPHLRDAREDELPLVLALLADDALGRAREAADPGPVAEGYRAAFFAIRDDPNQRFVVAELDGELVGCFQLSFIPGLSRGGMWRAQIEAVRVASHKRGAGIGSAMMRWAIEAARARGCGLVQLTSDLQRRDAHRFYARLGFVASHVGMKCRLDPPTEP